MRNALQTGFLVPLLALLLAGCASAPPDAATAARTEALLHAHLFHRPAITSEAAESVLSSDDIFALSPAMEQFLANEMRPRLRHGDSPRQLITTLYERGQLRLEYDALQTRTATDAFEQRRGNCLSMVIMTAALAKSLGLPVHYQRVLVEDTWRREQGTLFRSGHVNIILGTQQREGRLSRPGQDAIVVDFLPPDDARGLRGVEIEEATVIAMFMNNRAAEALTQNRLALAFEYVASALKADPGFVEALNTLGVVYNRNGNITEAEAVFRAGLELTPDNTQLLANLARLLRGTHRNDEARQMTLRLKALEPYAPYFFIDLARAAMDRHDYGEARRYFDRELSRDPDSHEAHFGLARAYLALGDNRAARDHLQEAIEHSNGPQARRRYESKLEHLRAAVQ